jgi:citrate synthase
VDASIITALAALTGAAVGGLTSGVAAWLNLYRDFIEEAAKCYIDALQHDEADIPGLVGLYAKLSSMRAVSSKAVVQRADDVVRKILDTYLEPDKSFVELREMAIDGSIDLLRNFSETCRDEFEKMRSIQF